jgi:3-hydroxyacyl-[acyl-carrier-protein] dehydratase
MRWGLIDEIESLTAGETAVGWRTFPGDLPLFEDHFPGFPVVPGVLLMESLAQLSGKLIGYTVRKSRGDWPFPILSMMNGVKFKRFVRPDQRVRLETEITALRDEMVACKVRVRLDGREMCRAEQIFVFNAVVLDDPAESARVESSERDELTRLWADYPGDF